MASYWSAVRKSESLQTYYLVGYRKDLTSRQMADIQYVGQNILYARICEINAKYKIFA